MKCQRCGAENQEGHIYCSTCGAQVQSNNVEQYNQMVNNIQNEVPSNSVNENIITNSTYSTQNVQQTPNVSYSTSQNNINNQGVTNYSNSTNQVQNANKKSMKNLIIIIIIIVVVAALALLGKYLYDQYKLKQIDKELQDKVDNIGTIDPIGGNSSGSTSNEKEDNKNTSYNVGDAVTLVDGSNWHVIGFNGDQVVLLSDTLTKESTGYGNDASEISQKYENSVVKQYLEETYLPSLKTSLQSKGGNISNLKVRLITVDEYLKLSGSKFYISSDSSISECWFTNNGNYDLSNEYYSDVPSYLAMTSSYWTMDNYKDYTNNNSSCKSDNGYFGAYYVEISTSAFDENSGRIQLNMDGYAIGQVNSYGTFLGIRPVIETDISNIK